MNFFGAPPERLDAWSRVYWTTKVNNYRARGLYDSYTPRSEFVQYRIDIR